MTTITQRDGELIKSEFTKQYLKVGGQEGRRNDSRKRTKEAAVWQRRFWERTIRDAEDLARHIDYIHFNPVKHGYVTRPCDWKWSSFYRYLRRGYYSLDWGDVEQDMSLSGQRLANTWWVALTLADF